VDAQEDSNASIRLTYFEKIMVVRDLARLLTQSKRLEEGILWLTDAYTSLSHRTAVELVWISNSLAILYDQQGETVKSLETQQRALSIQTAELGSDHLETINTVNELGRIYRHLGDYENAAKMHHMALSVLEKRLPEPEEHLEVIWTIATLARTYRKQGRFPEALTLFERAHRTRAKVLGPNHPHTLWILGDIGATYQDMGLFKDAEDSYRRALEGRQDVLGQNHPDTLWSINNYGTILERIGRRDEALNAQKQALSGQREVLGHEHKHTLWTLEVIRRLDPKNQGDVMIGCNDG
jgi:tetratricopeptide (TPR) repeat protein